MHYLLTSNTCVVLVQWKKITNKEGGEEKEKEGGDDPMTSLLVSELVCPVCCSPMVGNIPAPLTAPSPVPAPTPSLCVSAHAPVTPSLIHMHQASTCSRCVSLEQIGHSLMEGGREDPGGGGAGWVEQGAEGGVRGVATCLFTRLERV